MQKIISLFQRNYDGDGLVRDELVPGAEWVAAGEGTATRKFDGTCCRRLGGTLYKRYDAKHGKQPPAGFEPAQDPDLVTGHWPGWLKIDIGNPSDQWHFDALFALKRPLADGTYELIGPKINRNPECAPQHVFVRHGSLEYTIFPRTFDAIREFLRHADIEGVVWHHPDGRMVKIKTKDFGLKRPCATPFFMDLAES